MELGADDLDSLRRGIRDLVALTTLPEVWSGNEPQYIAESLSDVLRNILRLDVVYIRLNTLNITLELVRTQEKLIVGDHAQEIGKVFAPWLKTENSKPVVSIADPLSNGTLQIAVIPIGHNGKHGFAVAGTRTSNSLTELDRLLLSVTVNQAVTALQQAQLLRDLRSANQIQETLLAKEQAAHSEAQRTAERIALLQELTSKLSQALIVEQIAQAILQTSVKLLASHQGIVYVVSGDRQTVHVVDQVNIDEAGQAEFGQMLLTTSTPITDAIRRQEIIWIESLKEFIDQYPHLESSIRRWNVQSVAVVPFLINGQTMGCLGLSFFAPRKMTDEEVNLLSAIAEQGAQALERTRLYEAERQAREALQIRISQQSVVAELGQQALTSSNLPALMQEIVRVVAEILAVDFVKILELLPDREHLRLKTGIGWKEGYIGTATESADLRSQAGYALVSSGPVIVEDLQNETRFVAPSLLLDHGVTSGISVIVQGHERPWGVLGVHTAQQRIFAHHDIYFIQAVANVLGAAIEQSRLYEQAQELAVLKERQRLARELHDAVNQTLYSANTIAESLPRLWERAPERMDALLEQLRVLNKGAMAEMRTLLWELRPEALEKTAIDELFGQLIDAFRGRTKMQIMLALQIETRDPLPPEVQMAFYRVAQEALGNIIKHSQAKEVVVAFSSLPEKVELTITDDGRGFDTKSTSAGLGMGTMRERAESINARFQLTSTIGQGTKVTISWQRTVTSEKIVT